MFREGAALSTALALVCLACSGSRPPADTAAAETTSEPVMQGAAQGFGASLSADRHVYGTGEPIELELRVFNRTGQAMTFEFATGQRYDFVVTGPGGKEAWRWSEGRMFTQALGEETLDASRPELTYSETYAAGIGTAGQYRIEGRLTARNRTVSATVTIEVR